jgi:hypothetical protein
MFISGACLFQAPPHITRDAITGGPGISIDTAGRQSGIELTLVRTSYYDDSGIVSAIGADATHTYIVEGGSL